MPSVLFRSSRGLCVRLGEHPRSQRQATPLYRLQGLALNTENYLRETSLVNEQIR